MVNIALKSLSAYNVYFIYARLNFRKMADCLSLLRQYNVQKKEIIERDNLIIFDQLAWPKSVKTNYLIFRYFGGSQILVITVSI